MQGQSSWAEKQYMVTIQNFCSAQRRLKGQEEQNHCREFLRNWKPCQGADGRGRIYWKAGCNPGHRQENDTVTRWGLHSVERSTTLNPHDILFCVSEVDEVNSYLF